MRKLWLSLSFLPAAPLAAQVTQLAPGVVVEARVDGDLNGDGVADFAYVAHTEEWRALTVLLSTRGRADLEYRPEVLLVDSTGNMPTLSLEGDVLTLEDTTGGTTVVSSTRHFRYDARGGRMRLIGLDAAVYSRTHAHDGFETSWNLLNGDATTRELRLDGSGEAYKPGRERSFKRRIRAQYLADAPDPATVIEEMRDG